MFDAPSLHLDVSMLLPRTDCPCCCCAARADVVVGRRLARPILVWRKVTFCCCMLLMPCVNLVLHAFCPLQQVSPPYGSVSDPLPVDYKQPGAFVPSPPTPISYHCTQLTALYCSARWQLCNAPFPPSLPCFSHTCPLLLNRRTCAGPAAPLCIEAVCFAPAPCLRPGPSTTHKPRPIQDLP